MSGLTDLERIELVARRTASYLAEQGAPHAETVANAFAWFASELLSSRIGAEEEDGE